MVLIQLFLIEKVNKLLKKFVDFHRIKNGR